MRRRLVAVGACLLLIGVAIVAWRLRSSTADGYRALRRRRSNDKWVEGQLAEFNETVGVYGVIVLSAAIGLALIVSAVVH